MRHYFHRTLKLINSKIMLCTHKETHTHIHTRIVALLHFKHTLALYQFVAISDNLRETGLQKMHYYLIDNVFCYPEASNKFKCRFATIRQQHTTFNVNNEGNQTAGIKFYQLHLWMICVMYVMFHAYRICFLWKVVFSHFLFRKHSNQTTTQHFN